MDPITEMLAAQPFFRGFSEPQLARLAGCATAETFAPGSYLAREGADADRFYLITHGRVAVEVFAPGRVPYTFQSLEAGELLGWAWFYPPYRWHSDARAVQLTRVIAFDALAVQMLCDSDPVLGYELVKRFAQSVFERLQAARLQLADVYSEH
jgi:CRP-like cAMP-binding protein